MNFSWTRLKDGNCEIHIRTPVVEIGTLNRLTAAILSLNLDIVSGDVSTVDRDGILYSNDTFILRPVGNSDSDGQLSVRLGILMETILREHQDSEEFLKKHNISPPRKLEFFDVKPVIIFQKDENTHTTQFFIESQNRTGLLYHLTRILARENVDIVRAKILTVDNYLVQDTFYLQYNGEMLSDELSARIEKEITE